MFVIYHIRSTMLVGPNGHTAFARTYKLAHAAKKACDKLNSKPIFWGEDEINGPGDFGWCSAEHYEKNVVKMVERTNMRSGKKYMEPSNTPGYMSPSCESYWTM